jgi:hypothetical protein
MRIHKTLTSLATSIVCLAASAALADELYRQNPVPNGFGGYSAQDARNPGGLGWFSEVVDNFPGQAGWSVNSVEFWGGYVTDVPGNTRGFTIRFYAGGDGQIGPRLFEQDVLTFSEIEYYSTFIPGLGTVRGYHYTVNLPTPFVISSTDNYWVSVTAILDRGGTANEPQWGWAQALSIAQPPARQWFFSPGNFNSINTDMGFVLNGTAGGPACDPDYNQDGNADQDDVAYLVNVIAGGPNPTGRDPDFNQDGNADQDDYAALVNVIAGADCP